MGTWDNIALIGEGQRELLKVMDSKGVYSLDKVCTEMDRIADTEGLAAALHYSKSIRVAIAYHVARHEEGEVAMTDPLILDKQICPRHAVELTHNLTMMDSEAVYHDFTCPACGNVYLSVELNNGYREWRIGKDLVATVKDGVLRMVGDESQISNAGGDPV